MSGTLHKMLDIHGVISERHLRLLLRRPETVGEFLRRIGNAHSFPSASERRLDDDRISDLSRDLGACLGVIDRFGASRNDRNTCGNHGIARFLLIPKLCNDLGVGSDERDIALLAQLCEFAVLRQEPEARMYRVGARYDRGADDAVHAQITFRRRSRTDTDRLVRKLCMKGFPVRL